MTQVHHKLPPVPSLDEIEDHGRRFINFVRHICEPPKTHADNVHIEFNKKAVRQFIGRATENVLNAIHKGTVSARSGYQKVASDIKQPVFHLRVIRPNRVTQLYK